MARDRVEKSVNDNVIAMLGYSRRATEGTRSNACLHVPQNVWLTTWSGRGGVA